MKNSSVSFPRRVRIKLQVDRSHVKWPFENVKRRANSYGPRLTRKHNRIQERAATNENALERVARTALSVFTPPFTTIGRIRRWRWRALAAIVPCCHWYAVATWVAIGRRAYTHTHARAKCCTLGGLPASLFFPYSAPTPIPDPRYTRVDIRERERAYILHARAIFPSSMIYVWAACVSLTRVRRGRFTLASTILRHNSRTGTAGRARENPLLMPRVGRNSGIEPCGLP